MKKDRLYDKTSLTIDMAEARGMIHRDYIAHCFRWSHVVKFLMLQQRYKTARILDVGCGVEVPLAKSLYSNKMGGAMYMGVDLNKLEMPEMLVKANERNYIDVRLYPQCDFISWDGPPITPNIITNFETLEHVHPRICRDKVEKMYDVLEDEGHAFISTPCFNGSAAANHINEMGYRTVGSLLEDVGFTIFKHYGTFASIKDYKDELTDEQLELFVKLRDYYDTNVLATIFAPAFPAQSRNVLWHVQKTHQYSRQFSDLKSTLMVDENQHEDILELLREA